MKFIIPAILGGVVGSFLVIAAGVLPLTYELDQLPNLRACAKEYNVYECKLIAVPSDMKWVKLTKEDSHE